MNVRTLIVPSTLLAASLLSVPAFAAGGDPQDSTTLKPVRVVAQPPREKVFHGIRATRLLALETDVRPQDVRMIETTIARNARYQFGWQQKTGRRFAEALGSERFTAWSRGRPISLYSPAVIEEANRMAGLSPDNDAGTLDRVAINP